MYEIQRRKGRLLTASSLALAVILTTGASSAWAQGNTTISDGGTVSGPGDASTPITIVGATGTTADVTLGGAATTSVLGANGSVDTIEVSGANTLTIVGAGGNLVENTETNSAINLAIGLGTTVEVTGKGGTVGDVIGKGAGSSTFNIKGVASDNMVVNAGTISGVSFTFDPATINVDAIKDSGGLVDNQTTLNVKNDITNSTGSALSITADHKSAINVGGSVTNTNLTADNSSTITIGKNVENTLGSVLLIKSDNGSTIAVNGNISGSGVGSEWDIITGKNSTISVAGDISNIRNWQVGENSTTEFDVIKSRPITGNGTTSQAVIDDTASLYIVNTRVEETTLLSDFDGGIFDYNAATSKQSLVAPGTKTAGWNGNLLSFDTRLFDPNKASVRVNTAGDSVILDTRDAYRGAANAYADGRISNGTANMIDGLYMGRDNDVNSSNAGIKFVSRAVNENYLDQANGLKQNNGKKVVTTLEGAAAMASTAGVQTSTYSISNTLAENYNARLSYLRDTAPAAGSGEAGTIGVWINPFYNSTDVDGVRIGRHDGEYEFNYGGGTIGLDSNISDNFRLGLAFSAGGGDTESKGSNFNKTESDFDFWGLGVYGSYTNGMFGLTGDVSYSSTSYDIDQRIPGLGMNKLTADVDTDAFTVGLTGEYRFLTSNNLNIIPHLGLRYTNLKTDSYRVKEKGVGDVFKISSETQNIWTIPLGVTFTGEVATSSDWVIQPKADLGVIFAAGDLDADSKFRINGTNYGGRVTADDVVDAVTFNGLVGLKAENCDGFSVGLDYNFKASDNLTSHGVTGTIRYDF